MECSNTTYRSVYMVEQPTEHIKKKIFVMICFSFKLESCVDARLLRLSIICRLIVHSYHYGTCEDMSLVAITTSFVRMSIFYYCNLSDSEALHAQVQWQIKGCLSDPVPPCIKFAIDFGLPSNEEINVHKYWETSMMWHTS